MLTLPRLLILLLSAISVMVSQDILTSPQLRRYRSDTFQSPRAGVRWRHWIQDAWIEDGVLESDVAEMARVGSEGFELLSYQSYGQRGPTLEDPTTYSYGAELFTDCLIRYANEARKHGLFTDWAMGPNQAAGVPYHPDLVDTPGFNTELVLGKSEYLEAGSAWNGTLPEPELVPLTGYDGVVNFTAPIHERVLEGVVTVQLLPGTNRTADTVDLDYSTWHDLTSLVRNGTSENFTYTAPDGEPTLILAFYSRRNGYPEAVPGFNGPLPNLPGSWGSYVHDHFSVQGAQKAIESNQQWILSRALDALNQDNTGSAMWTDSNEFRAQLYWTSGLAGRFLADHNYSIALALPVLFGGSRPFGGANTPSQVFDYGSSFSSERLRNDYKQTLTNAYLEYGSELTKYARSIGLKYSDQPAYNFPLDVGAAATIADVPECESLGQPSIDLIRQFTGGVNLAGRNILSSEMGAGRYLAYEATMVQLIQDARLGFAGGVNQIILHGYPSSTNYVQTSWPGLTPFVYEFSAMHGPRQPAWRHYDQYMEIFGREMWFLRRGVPKVDVAVLRYGWDLEFDSKDKTKKNVVFKTDDLTRSGYSYEYVSSYALSLPNVTVQDGVLMPTGPGYKALLLNRSQNLTVEAARRVLTLAQDGLPVVILGSVPDDIPGYDPDGSRQASVKEMMQTLTSLERVVQIDQEADVPSALTQLGVQSSATIYSGIVDYPPVVRKRQESSTVDLFYIFNQGQSGRFSIGLEMSSTNHTNSFVLDQLTGTVSPAPVYGPSTTTSSTSSRELRLNTTFDLTSNQTLLLALTSSPTYQNCTSPPVTVVSIDDGLTAVSRPVTNSNSSSNTVSFTTELRSAKPGIYNYSLSNGTQRKLDTSRCTTVPTMNLTNSNWTLILQSWTPSANLSDVRTVITNSTIQLTNGLIPWDEIEDHYNTSGVGLYSTTFTWPPLPISSASSSSLSQSTNTTNCSPMNSSTSSGFKTGAYLLQSQIQHTQRVWLNNHQLPVIDPVDPQINISPYLTRTSTPSDSSQSQASINELIIEVASPLLNALNALNDPQVESVGYTRARKLAEGNVKRGHGRYGLFGDVLIVPFQAVEVL